MSIRLDNQPWKKNSCVMDLVEEYLDCCVECTGIKRVDGKLVGTYSYRDVNTNLLINDAIDAKGVVNVFIENMMNQ